MMFKLRFMQVALVVFLVSDIVLGGLGLFATYVALHDYRVAILCTYVVFIVVVTCWCTVTNEILLTIGKWRRCMTYKLLIITEAYKTVHTVVADFGSQLEAEAAYEALVPAKDNNIHISTTARRLYADPSAPTSAWG
jgi:hypothetical protein